MKTCPREQQWRKTEVDMPGGGGRGGDARSTAGALGLGLVGLVPTHWHAEHRKQSQFGGADNEISLHTLGLRSPGGSRTHDLDTR